MRIGEIIGRIAWAATIAAVAGCQSFEIMQRSRFTNDNGELIEVGYGRSEKDHINSFVSPSNGKEMEFRSRLAVRVDMPDGDSFNAWQCMNFTGAGTTYRSDNEDWMFLANGFTAFVYRREEESGRYREVFRGVLCNTPGKKPERDNRWKKVRTQPRKFTNESTQ